MNMLEPMIMKTETKTIRGHLKVLCERLLWASLCSFFTLCSAATFEGRIAATITRGGETETLIYTVGSNQVRIERGENNLPYAKNILDLNSGAMTILFPHNRSFIQLNSGSGGSVPPPPTANPMPPAGIGMAPVGPTNLPGAPMSAIPQMPAMPPGVGPQAGTAPGVSAMPAMPMMPPMAMEPLELKATGGKTNLLGYACLHYEIKQRGEAMEIWATDKLFAFQPYQPNQPHRFGPRMIEEQWGDLLKAKKLFPLLAILRFETPQMPGTNAPSVAAGPERLRFEVKAITREKIEDETVFEPPTDYREIQPLPF